jgi:hypothetical protein
VSEPEPVPPAVRAQMLALGTTAGLAYTSSFFFAGYRTYRRSAADPDAVRFPVPSGD